MDALPTLFTLARVLDEEGLKAILIGNAATALHGAPVTDFDFLFRKTPGYPWELKAVAKIAALRSRAARIDFLGPRVVGRGPGGYHQE
jgi:hypothetical protein